MHRPRDKEVWNIVVLFLSYYVNVRHLTPLESLIMWVFSIPWKFQCDVKQPQSLEALPEDQEDPVPMNLSDFFRISAPCNSFGYIYTNTCAL